MNLNSILKLDKPCVLENLQPIGSAIYTFT